MSRFNSLQTGKRIQRIDLLLSPFTVSVFQFPSNGKADPKTISSWRKNEKPEKFQFPSNGKADPKKNPLLMLCSREKYCFNSLQTGKRIQSVNHANNKVSVSSEFQFPSNGKADPKLLALQKKTLMMCSSFNSLQTGKRIQSCWPCRRKL